MEYADNQYILEWWTEELDNESSNVKLTSGGIKYIMG
jgi:hypothetical protein